MKKQLLTIAAAFLMGGSAFAGGYLANTNQNVAFLRNPAQGATISVQGAYSNPAGVGFLDKGWYLGLNIQNARQTREIESTYAPFALGIKNEGNSTVKYVGKTYAPVIPSFDLAYVHNEHFFGSFHFGITSGGGKAVFDKGLGSFESQIAIIAAALNGMAGADVFKYDADIDMTGEQYTYSGQLNLGYRLNDHLSFSAGLRVSYLSNHFDANIKNIKLQQGANPALPAGDVIIATFNAKGIPLSDPQKAAVQSMFADRQLDCSQSAVAFAPVLGIDYKTGPLNVAARYEFNTSVRLKNKTAEGKDAGLAQYKDGRDDVANDIPALFVIGAQYSVLENLRVSAQFNHYFEKQSKVYNPISDKNDRTNVITGNSSEVLGGIEWDPIQKLTVSCGAQYFFWKGDDEEFQNDQCINPDVLSVGGGFRYKFTDRFSADVAVFKSFYNHATKEMADYNGVGMSTANKLRALGLPNAAIPSDKMLITGTDRYYRTSFVLGIGLNYNF